jgi:hypothetical protein
MFSQLSFKRRDDVFGVAERGGIWDVDVWS